ncbi:hypothetical protein [Paraburkholderia kururiensis]|uniref:hypothetical protein n=1 Tax=Paraburkholderia kururiensis TaxID=984307 RepID=UPI00398A86AC
MGAMETGVHAMRNGNAAQGTRDAAGNEAQRVPPGTAAHTHPITHPMPEVAAFVAQLRQAFGDAVIEEAIHRGKAGEPAFFAAENGRTVGTRALASTQSWVVDAAVRDRYYCPGCAGSCVGTGAHCRRP